MKDISTISPSFISTDIMIEGNLISTGRVLISGQIKGNISASSIGVESSGKITGNISAEDTELMGWQKGNIFSKKVSIISGSKTRGNIKCEKLIVDHGSDISGKISASMKIEPK
tara:strand:- start:277 stop:618 length:342 start_codon:yes stop_codon:yes gene_type:complete